MGGRTARLFPPFAAFAGVSFLLWRFPHDFLLYFPLYGLVFIWFYYHNDREFKFLFLFLISAIGFLLPKVSGLADQMRAALLAFGEVFGLWALAAMLHSLNSSRLEAEAALAAAAEAEEAAGRAVKGEIARYGEHMAALKERIRLQSSLAASIKVLSSSVEVDEIKKKLSAIVTARLKGAVVSVSSGAPRDAAERWTLERKIPLLIKDSAADPRFPAGAFGAGDASLMVVPLNLFGAPSGFVRVSSPQAGAFSEPDLGAAELITAISAVSMENISLFEKVRELAIRDALTGLDTRRSFDSRLEEELLRAARSKVPFALLMTDIDHFKNFNDTYGHQAGDEVLKVFAAALAGGVRDVDFVARYGGEEFAVILSGLDTPQAAAVAEALRARVEACELDFGGAKPRLTASFGAASFPADAATESQLLRAADERLYKAKQAGRNRVAYE